MRFIGSVNISESTLKEWILSLEEEHAGYYGTPYGSFGSWGYKSPEYIRNLINPYGIGWNYPSRNWEGNDIALRALGIAVNGFTHSDLGGMWVTSGGNVIAAWSVPDEVIVLADGARHGIPWPPFINEKTVTKVYHYCTYRPDRAPWEVGLEPTPPEGAPLWNPTKDDE